MMKTKYLIFPLFILAVFMFASCDDDLLDTYPTQSLASDTYWTSTDNVDMYLAGCYSKLKGNYLTWTRGTWDGATDNGYCKGYYSENFNVQIGILDADNCNYQNKLYSACYAGIAQCNIFLANYTQVEMTEAEAEQYEAEARFLRAFFYFELVQRWSGVVVYTEVASELEDLKIAKSTEDEVYDLIEEDLDYAVEHLSNDVYGGGHAVKTTAQALQARIALFREDWDEVVSLTSSIISSGKYGLSDLRAPFVDDADNEGVSQDTCSEILFSVKYTDTSDGCQSETDHGGEVGFFRQSGLVPTQDLIDQYESGDLRLTNWYFDCPDMTTFTRSDGYTFTVETCYTYYGLIKFARIWNDNLYGSTSSVYTGNDYPLIRLTEVYLMYIEAMIENNGSSTTDANAVKYMNAIRSRAGVSTYTSVTEDELRAERRRELAMEGFRWFDITRWQIGSQNTGKTIYGSNTIVWKDKFYLWPFSTDELDVNTNLVQNDGY